MKLTEQDLNKLASLAQKAAKAAGTFIRDQWEGTLEINVKEDIRKNSGSRASEVVTWVDIRSQSIILDILKESILEYDLGLLTEESKDDHSRLIKDYFWCIDPLDGTLPFTEKRPGYSVSIALIAKVGTPVIGVIYNPVNKKEYTAVNGQWVNSPKGKQTTIGQKVLVCYFDRSMLDDLRYPHVYKQLEALQKSLQLESVKIITGYGAVMNACEVLEHQNAIYFKLPKKPPGGGSIWDFAATTCLFKQLGLTVSDVDGDALHLNNPSTTFMNHGGVVFASNNELHEKLVDLLKGF